MTTTTASEDRVDPLIKPFLIDNLAERRQKAIVARAVQRRQTDADPVVRDLLHHWPGIIQSSLPELSDRLHRSANLVFATCSAATTRNVNRANHGDLFDWVVIEEAAKAWPTELAIPMARGLRWTLVGDHQQLPAHRRREVLGFLAECQQSDDEDLSIHAERREDYLEVFDLFGSLFDQEKRPDPAEGRKRPRHTLGTQYRMRPALNEVVGRRFYPDPEGEDDGAPLPTGLLRTGRDDVPVLQRPSALRGAVTWIDTTDLTDCVDAPAWTNAGEVDVVEQLLDSKWHPRPRAGHDGYGDHPLAVLTPYRKQGDLMRGRGAIRDHVYTIHAFQGREANVVVASLVRDQARGEPHRPWQSIGHLVQPGWSMCCSPAPGSIWWSSGSIAHFERYGGKLWPTCARSCGISVTCASRTRSGSRCDDADLRGLRRRPGPGADRLQQRPNADRGGCAERRGLHGRQPHHDFRGAARAMRAALRPRGPLRTRPPGDAGSGLRPLATRLRNSRPGSGPTGAHRADRAPERVRGPGQLASGETDLQPLEVLQDRLSGHVRGEIGYGAPPTPKLALPGDVVQPPSLDDISGGALTKAVQTRLEGEAADTVSPSGRRPRTARMQRVLEARVDRVKADFLPATRWIPLEIMLHRDPDTGRILVTVVDSHLPIERQERAAQRLSQIIEENPHSAFVQHLSAQVQTDYRDAPSLETRVARFVLDATGARTAPAGTRQQRHSILKHEAQQLRAALLGQAACEVETRVIASGDEYRDLVKELIDSAERQIVLAAETISSQGWTTSTPRSRRPGSSGSRSSWCGAGGGRSWTTAPTACCAG